MEDLRNPNECSQIEKDSDILESTVENKKKEIQFLLELPWATPVVGHLRIVK